MSCVGVSFIGEDGVGEIGFGVLWGGEFDW